MHGLSLRSDAMRLVCDFLHSSMDAEQALAALLAALQSVNRESLRAHSSFFAPQLLTAEPLCLLCACSRIVRGGRGGGARRVGARGCR
jgi:hypothetical protein